MLDKLKQDVVGRTPDKCVALMDPSRQTPGQLSPFFRQFFLKSYNKFLNNFEAGEEQPLLAGFQKLSFL